jgi:ABC-2 type transport system ATP-binding protein
MITAEALSRNYGDFIAVREVSFQIPRGTVIGLLGHNGAGKTTIMKVLTGYLEPTSGSVQIDGLDIIPHRLEVQKKIGYLPENSPVYPEMTVIDYLEYVAELRGIAPEQRANAIRNAIQRTRLEEKSTDSIQTLSRGYKQRVGVAQAILHEPEILILDEPTNGLDPSQIQEMRQLIRELSQKATVILSTHILQEVHAVCDRVLIISRGSVVLDSPISELSTSNQFLLETDTSLERVQQQLKAISVIKDIQHIGAHNGTGPERQEYRITLSTEDPSTSAHIVRALVEGGSSVFQFQAETKNLESIFKEVSNQ